VAAMLRDQGYTVTGSDESVYPPMSTFLAEKGIAIQSGYKPENLPKEDVILVVGNTIKRGNAELEAALEAKRFYLSLPETLKTYFLRKTHNLVVTGTHGKTTTSSLLAWLLEDAGLKPGFLVGGVPANFGISARLGESPFFVIEADEYDTAFFDKRSKFVHYRPRTAILNNLEYDHADIFPDLAAIERQFHHLIRTVPGRGRLIVNGADPTLPRVLAQGCWSEVEEFDAAGGWSAELVGGQVRVAFKGEEQGRATMRMAGRHNRSNALAAVAAVVHAGVPVAQALDSLSRFRGVKRRLELLGEVRGVQVYDDFAHHPTAIGVTLAALREAMAASASGRILAVLEPRSNTMRLGGHSETLAQSLAAADEVYVYARPDLKWDAEAALATVGSRLHVHSTLETLQTDVVAAARPGDRVLVMSNGDFGGIHARLLAALGS